MLWVKNCSPLPTWRRRAAAGEAKAEAEAKREKLRPSSQLGARQKRRCERAARAGHRRGGGEKKRPNPIGTAVIYHNVNERR